MEVHFKKNGSRDFLIHWKGFSHKEDSWEPEKNLNCPDLIEKFMEKVNKASEPMIVMKLLILYSVHVDTIPQDFYIFLHSSGR